MYCSIGQCNRGHSNILTRVMCLSIDPAFFRKSVTQWPPFFKSLHPMTPFYFSIWLGNYSFSISSSQESHCSSSFHFKVNFSFNLVDFGPIFRQIFIGRHQIVKTFGQFFRPIFSQLTLNDPLFLDKILHR